MVIDILTEMGWYLDTVLICIFLIAWRIKHFSYILLLVEQMCVWVGVSACWVIYIPLIYPLFKLDYLIVIDISSLPTCFPMLGVACSSFPYSAETSKSPNATFATFLVYCGLRILYRTLLPMHCFPPAFIFST